MESGVLVGFISVGFLVILNLLLAAYTYGKLSEKVQGLCDRVDKLENKVFAARN